MADKKAMTVAELREKLNGIPGETTVLIACDEYTGTILEVSTGSCKWPPHRKAWHQVSEPVVWISADF